MPLLDHLRELRSRLLRGVLAIVAATVLGFVCYEQLLAFLTEPYRGIEPQLADGQPELPAAQAGPWRPSRWGRNRPPK